MLASVGCGAKQQIVYVDPIRPGGYVPAARGSDPRVHTDGHYQPAADVQIGSAHAAGSPSYTPMAESGGQLVHAGAGSHVVAPAVAIAGERAAAAAAASSYGSAASAGTHGSAAPASQAAAVAPAASPATVASAGSLGPAASAASHSTAASAPAPVAANAARPAASPTSVARLALGPALGASAGTSAPGALLDVDEEREEGQASIVGKIESIAGPQLKIQTPAGSQGVRLAERARVEREALGSTNDLKPGQFVGIIHLPSGPADAVRLYATGPTMPRPGVAPMVGSRNGQVTTFGSIVKLEFGGLLLNTGSQTTTVTLPNGVPILRPASQSPSDLTVGNQVVASGRVDADGSLVASAVRVTGEPRPVAQAARPGR